MAHALTWNGHSNFTVKTDGMTILIDPFFDGNPKSVLAAKDITQVDYVLVTHDHGDHVGQAMEICLATGAKLLAIVETCSKLVGQGLPKEQVVNGIGINIGGSISLGTVRATMVQAVHSSESGWPVGYVLTLGDGYTLYHSGDTAIFATMELYGKLFSIDMALLPVGGVFTMDARQAAVACKLLKCRQVLPMHWGTFPVLERNTRAFGLALEDLGVDTMLVNCEPGQTVKLERNLFNEDCGCE
ncbi:metal-dependent hydrolase [Fundidesulfovibrio terrae]|uniref:metal-dependent hydrolase n=1 Tax=Fundidesulfovibrio terrae TaxID=2922866 RepID=UPI001FAF8B32|nr:metal-dependent hydrolase [Fundidesulfovibrio terrae]